MPTYLTKIRKPTGETEEQLLTVPQESQLGEYLSRLEGFVLDCSPYETQSAVIASPEPRTRTHDRSRKFDRWRSRPTDRVVFCWFLYTLVHAGVPLARALEIVAHQMADDLWRRVIGRVIASLEKGNSFADSLKEFPRFFPATWVHMVDVGEMSGNLDRVLEQIASSGEKQLENKSKLVSVMIYPAILMLACGGVICFMLAFVVPRVAKMFSNLKMELPALTSVLLTLGSILKVTLPFILAGLVLLPLAFLFLRQTVVGQRSMGWISLNVPLIGKLYQKLVFSRYCQNLAIMQSSGVPLLVCLSMARAGLHNPLLDDFFLDVESNLQEGVPLGEQLARCPYIPHMVSSMITVGEETGRLSEMLMNVSRFYDRDIQNTVRTLPKIIEPAVIVIMTVVVGIIAASVFLPLATLTQGIG